MHNIRTENKPWSIRNFLHQVILHNWHQIHGKEMVCVTGGKFIYGDNKQEKSLPEFWIDRTPVTNREFARFVKATGYKTTAEKTGLGCAYTGSKWEDVPGADWRYPGGPNTDIQGKWEHPVLQVSWTDAWLTLTGQENGCRQSRSGRKLRGVRMGVYTRGGIRNQHVCCVISTGMKTGQRR